MDKNMKKAILKNRVKLLNLDYFDLSGPLLASEIFPSKKHKEIKTQANDSKARVDLLLEWLEESAPKEAFPIFLNGIRNCKELILAKKIKREASGKEEGSGADAKPKPSGSTIPLDQLLAEIIPTLPASLPAVAAAPGKAKKPRTPKAKTNVPAAPAPINGLPSTNLLPPPPPPVTKKRKAEGGDAKQKQPKLKLPKPKPAASAASGTAAGTPKPATVKTPKAKGGAANKQNGTPKTGSVANSRSSTPKASAAALAAAAAAAAAKAAAAMAAAATPRATRKSSSSDTVQGKADSKAKGGAAKKGKQDKKDAAAGTSAGGSSPKRTAAARGSNPMTFKEVEEKQQDFKNKFKFTNSNAVAKVIHFKDKSDITYLGCPFLVNNKMCGKKVELKSKEFICEAKHKNPNCRQIPRLLVTCNDGTADLVLTLMRQNVEIFSGKSESDIESMTVDEIKGVLEKAVGKKINVEVNSEKAKKQGAKKGSAVKWNNVATIIDESEEPPNKKKRKN